MSCRPVEVVMRVDIQESRVVRGATLSCTAKALRRDTEVLGGRWGCGSDRATGVVTGYHRGVSVCLSVLPVCLPSNAGSHPPCHLPLPPVRRRRRSQRGRGKYDLLQDLYFYCAPQAKCLKHPIFIREGTSRHGTCGTNYFVLCKRAIALKPHGL